MTGDGSAVEVEKGNRPYKSEAKRGDAGLAESAEGEAAVSHVLEPRSPGRKWIAIGVLAVLLGVAWKTLDPGKIRYAVAILLAAFALRILVSGSSSR